MKNIFLAVLILSGAYSFSQTAPTLVSYELDTLCNGDYYASKLKLIVEDLDGDSTYLSNLASSNTSYIDNYFIQDYNIPISPTQREIKISLNAGFALLPGTVNLCDLTLTIMSDNVSPETIIETIVDAPAYGNIDPTSTPIDACLDGQLIDVREYFTPGNFETYEWDGDYDYMDGYMMDANVYASAGLDGLELSITNSAGCEGYAYASVNILNPPPISTSFSNPTACNIPNGSATVSVSAGAFPLEIYWSTGELITGFMGGSSTTGSLAPGVYYANVTDANGCKVTKSFYISDDSDIDIAGNVTDESCKDETQDGSVELDLFIDPSTEPINNIFWSNGENTEDIFDLHAGEYTVIIHTDGGCVGVENFHVNALPPLSVELWGVTDYNCSTGMAGSVDISTSGGSGTYSWDWTTTGDMTEDLLSAPGGVHECIVTDDVTGCSMTWFQVVNEYGGPYVYIDNYNLPNCGETNGKIEVSAYSGFAPIASYEWSTGATTEDLLNIGQGNYTLTVTDDAGCRGFAIAEIGTKLPYQPDICLLTVDSSLTYNQIVWEKDPLAVVEGFNIYRETSSFGVFDLIASRDAALESFFQDNLASPVERSWRYYITSYDECGNESHASKVHKTMHAVANTSDGLNFTISWDQYEGIPYSSATVYRYTSATGFWTDLGSTGITYGSISDTPPTTGGLNYLVEFNLAFPCTSTKATDHNSSRSNTTSAIFNPGGSTLEIETPDLGEISVYPNPSSGIFVIELENPSAINTIEIRDITGSIIYSQSSIGNINEVDLSGLSSGIYFIEFLGEAESITEKIVIQ